MLQPNYLHSFNSWSKYCCLWCWMLTPPNALSARVIFFVILGISASKILTPLSQCLWCTNSRPRHSTPRPRPGGNIIRVNRPWVWWVPAAKVTVWCPKGQWDPSVPRSKVGGKAHLFLPVEICLVTVHWLSYNVTVCLHKNEREKLAQCDLLWSQCLHCPIFFQGYEFTCFLSAAFRDVLEMFYSCCILFLFFSDPICALSAST